MEGNSLTSFENLCKIFEMRIKLDKKKNTETPEEVYANYEKYAKKIDAIYNEEFQKELRPLLSAEVTLEKEEKRLKKIIKLLEHRLEKRKELEENYYNVTDKYIDGLQMIASEDELLEKKRRLQLISSYLETSAEEASIKDSMASLRDLLEKEEEKRDDYLTKNGLMEDELYTTFITKIKEDDNYGDINEENINELLEEIRKEVKETKETMDITLESIDSLRSNGLKEDYTTYIEEAKRNYYTCKNREIILKIYKSVSDFEDEFKALFAKREKLMELLDEEKNLSESLEVTSLNKFQAFTRLVKEQLEMLKNEKEVLDNITNYESRIKFKEERLKELEDANNSLEILPILREYGLIDTYVSNGEEEIAEEETVSPLEEKEEDKEDEQIVKEIYNPYHIVAIKDYPKTLNVALAKLKGLSVREKVNKKLNPELVPDYNEILASLEERENTPKEEMPSPPKVEEGESKDSKTYADNLLWMQPSEEDKENKVDASSTKEDNKVSNGTFWVPVSDTKLENNTFPTFTIPVAQSEPKDKLETFTFPTINDKGE